MFYEIDNSCLMCRHCIDVCSSHAVYFNGYRAAIDPEKCVGCGLCAKGCFEGAIRPHGEPAQAPAPVTEFDLICDFAVVGGGPAGLTAAAYAAEHGKKVILLEKTQRLGGAGVYATLLMPVGTKWEAEAGVPDLTDALVKCAMNATNWKLDPQLVRAAYHASGQVFDWLCSWCEMDSIFHLGPTFGGRYGVDLKSPDMPSGRYIMPRLAAHAKQVGVDIRMGHTAKKLLLENGRIRGLIAETPQGEVTIHAPNVLLSTGAMTVSPELERFDAPYANALHTINGHRFPGSTGDGVRMLEQAGIPIDQAGVCNHYLAGMPVFFDAHVLQQSLRPDTLKVNLNGERWTNEALERMSTVGRLLPQPKGVSWTIVDAAGLQREPMYVQTVPYTKGGLMVAAGLPKPGQKPMLANFMGLPVMLDENGEPMKLSGADGGEENRGMGDYPAGSKPTDAQMRKLEQLPGGHVFCGDTLEELAEKIGVPASTLIDTVARYNENCTAGKDTDFFKDREYLFPLQTGPYYAFRTVLCSDGVFGGAFIDSHCRALDGKTPVSGLYCAGDMTSGNYIRQADNRVEIINDFTWAFSSGFLVAGQVLGKRNA